MGRAVAVLVVLGLCGPAFADEPLAAPLYDLPGPRSLALGGAERASGTTNDAVWLNPAALAEAPRYTITLDGLYDLQQGGHAMAGLSVADSTTAPVAAGLAAHRVWYGPPSARTAANVFNLGLSTSLGDMVSFGAGGKLLHTREADGTHNRFTPDLGLFIKATPIQVGFVAYNLISPVAYLAPRQYAVAANLALPSLPRVEGDVVLDTSTRGDTSLAYHVGAEYPLLSLLTLRAGYLEDRTLGQRAVSGGFGISIPPGVGLDVGYRQDLLGAQPAHELVIGFNMGL